MGAVYLAVRDDDQYQKRVALKLVKRGMDTADIVRRFRHERQILASLDHPNIAKLLDGGATPDGLPYFVMEYIEGEPITDYCDSHRLSTIERLRLFRTVCAAVQSAHRNLVVHRDIKPGNILVTAEGAPRLLDFGIAKLLNPEMGSLTIDPTATALRLMTPEYASPEQVRGELITTASDVYSLGVVLYELLTGHRPYRLKSRLPHEILRIVCEEEPERPSVAISRTEEAISSDGAIRATLTPESVSRTRDGKPETLRRRLKGDLDNIVLMAMRKEPQRRHASAEQLSEDLRRHLEGLPVIARKDTYAYRSVKFVQRHKAGVAAVAIILLTLLGGIVATARQAGIARAEQAKAQAALISAEAQRVRAENEKARAENETTKAEEQRRRAEDEQAEAEAQRALAEQAQLIAETERAKAEGRFNDVRKLANSFVFEFHDRIEQLQGSTPVRKLLVERALAYLDSLAREAKDDLSLQSELAAAYQKIGDVQGRPLYSNLGDTGGALESYRKALSIREKIAAASHAKLQPLLDLALSCDRYGDALIATSHAVKSLESYRRELDILQTLARAHPNDLQVKRDLGRAFMKVGDALGSPSMANIGDATGALDSYRQSLAICQEVSDANPGNVQDRFELALSHNRMGMILQIHGDLESAMKFQGRSLELLREVSSGQQAHTQAKRDISISHSNLGGMLFAAGDTIGGLSNLRESLKIAEELAKADPQNANFHLNRAVALDGIGQILLVTGDSTGAAQNLRHAMEIAERLVAADPKNEQARLTLTGVCIQLGHALLATGDLGTAKEMYLRALKLSEQTAAIDPKNVIGSRSIAMVLLNNSTDAAESLPKALALAESLAKLDPKNADAE
jgi:tetratricopeptide (TPR) repeat protein